MVFSITSLMPRNEILSCRKAATTTVLGEVINEDGPKPEKIEFKVSGKEILEPGWRVVYAKQLIGQNQGVSNIEITDSNIKSFERVARKYGVDFALKKDKSGDIPKYLVFFKARDADALTAAFKEYTAKEVRRASKDRPSVLEQLRALKAKVLSLTPDKARNKEKGLEL